jgi:hypothetical protein
MAFVFAAKSINDLQTADYNAGRVARETTISVFVECANGTWCELDADDGTHAEALAIAWVDNHDARGASCWRINPKDGTVIGRSFFNYYASAD